MTTPTDKTFHCSGCNTDVFETLRVGKLCHSCHAAQIRQKQDKNAEREALRKKALETGAQAHTPSELAAEELLQREFSRRRLLPFITRFLPGYQAGWVHKDICQRLEKFSQDVVEKKSPRLMLFLPPRSGKSEIASRNFPAWHLGRNPSHEIIACSYSGSLAMKFSRKVRSLLREPGYTELFPACKLDPDTQSVEFWQTTAGGAYMAAGVSGPLTGNGAHCCDAETLIQTREGLRSIKSLVEAGEAIYVLAYDHESNQPVFRRAHRFSKRKIWEPLYEIETTLGSVVTTGEHPVYVNGKGYIPAGDVCPGGEVRGPGTGATVIRIGRRESSDGYVYNLSVDGTENYFANGILTHNCLIIDDPVKNREEAESETTRSTVKDWYTSSAYTRLAPGGGVLIVLTRWHHDDLAGWLLEEQKTGGDQWEVVLYPAIAEHDEKYRKKGEALHPERYDIEALQRIRRAVGPRDWQALYQQNPTSSEGDYFKKGWFRFYTPEQLPPLNELTKYTAWDLAIGKKESNDWSVGITVGVDRSERIWVLDVTRGRWDAHELVEEILDGGRTWDPERVGIERGQISMALGPLIEKRIAERKQWEFPYDPEGLKTGKADKELRARPIQGRMRQGRVLFPKDAAWLSGLISEMLAFPSGVHDDQVDALAWIGQMINLFTTVPVVVEKKASWKDKLLQLTHREKRNTPMSA